LNITHILHMSAPEVEELRDAIASALKAIRYQQPPRLSVKGKLVAMPTSGELIVVGDIHGDADSLEHILLETGFEDRVIEGENLYLLCLGDYIDRGPGQIRVLHRLLRLLGSYPGRVILLRGNHEGPRDVPFHPHDFPVVLRAAYGLEATSIYWEFRALCDELYTAAVVPGKTLFLHGGVPVGLSGLDDLAYANMEHPAKDNLIQALWNDPMEEDGVQTNPRGVGRLFGPDEAKRALRTVGVSTLVRSHQSCEGFLWVGDTLTIFSCRLPDYGNRRAAYLRMPLDEKLSTGDTGFIRLF
jgi:hypothetical protein